MLIKTRPPVSFWVCGCERFINNLHSPFRQTQERLYDTTDGLCLSYRTEKSIWPISQRDCQSFLPLFHTSDASRLSLSLSLDHSSAESRCQVHTELFIKNRGFQIGMQDERVRPAAGQVRPTRFPQGSDLLFIVSVQIDETLPCIFFSADTKQSWQGWAKFCNKTQYFTVILSAETSYSVSGWTLEMCRMVSFLEAV